jgi:tetratricopeptide (TPR) repeat protein
MNVVPEPGADLPLRGPDARGAQGAQFGTGNTQINNFYVESRSLVWPHQVGSVPLLADCYQPREREAARLDKAPNTDTVVLTEVLSGLGGVGKTQLAASYARCLWERGDVDLLVWATAGTRTVVQATYAQAATEIGQFPLQDAERAAEWFLGWLQATKRRWLVVLDDVADPADLRGLWPNGRSGRTVVTTRRRDAVLTDRGRRLIDIGLYTPAEAVGYLHDKLAAAGTEVMAEASELAADLGYLPLALAQAATFIRDRGDTCAGYRCRLSDRRRRLTEILPDDALADDYRSTVAATWSISVEHADQLAPVGLASPVLQLVSTLEPNGVPVEIVTCAAARSVIAEQRVSFALDVPAALDEQDCRDALRSLHRFSLISLDPMGGARAIRTHALVQRATLERLSVNVVSTMVRAAADALVQAWPDIERNTELGRILRENSMALAKRYHRILWSPDGHPVLFRAGRSLGESGQVAAAIRYWEQMVVCAAELVGIDHHDTFTSREQLARWRGEAGDRIGAAIAFDELVTDCQRVLGSDDLGTLKMRHLQAYWHGQSGDAVGAVGMFEEVFNDRLRLLGPDHRATLSTRAELARWRGESGDPVAAAAAFEELVSDNVRLFGPEDPGTLTSRHNFAYWRAQAGGRDEAVAVLEKLVSDRQRVLGSDHPDTLVARADLAASLSAKGDLARATAAFTELLNDRLRILGPDNPRTLRTRSNLARCHGEAGDSASAVASFEELFTDRLRVLGPDHPDTLGTQLNLAIWRGKAGDPVGAVAALEHLLADYLRVLGAAHIDTLSTRVALARWRGQAGDRVGAIASFEELLATHLRVLAINHPLTLDVKRSLDHLRRKASGVAGDIVGSD